MLNESALKELLAPEAATNDPTAQSEEGVEIVATEDAPVSTASN